MMVAIVLPIFAFGMFNLIHAQVNNPDDPCHFKSCNPATGNLLIGRESRLFSTSTCGERKPERFCIVSHLEDPKKCFTCDSRQPYIAYVNNQSHRIENVVTRKLAMQKTKWWQSENGRQNVSIRLDLEAEFRFTHLVITFRTYRPAAMLIERSSDNGRTWRVYRYFAYDCAESFPGVPTEPPRKHTDVVCLSRYSNVAPSSGGEVVFKALSPQIPVDDPYSADIQDLLRMTNLRINFTKLHTLGDNLLDNRPEIAEKYYYAIYDMVVRGSCSCYGHASRCIPIDDMGVGFTGGEDETGQIVHGRCECTHHTAGLNCEKCEDFYNDLPWKPAVGLDRSECKRCDCNDHATRCHFDRAVYQASGFVSGGVCDECDHNTMGVHCEQCKPYWYQEPGRDIRDPYICRQCECDARGSENLGICDSQTDVARGLVAGKCHCKINVDGVRCDACKNGYWKLEQDNPLGCRACPCNTTGTIGNQGCDKKTGACTCKRLVEGEKCDRCLPEHWGLSEEPEGCKPCDCDPGGAYTNQCDTEKGRCNCRPHFEGRRCDQPESGYYCPPVDYYTYEAEQAEGKTGNAQVEKQEVQPGRQPDFTGDGYLRVVEGTTVEFTVNNIRMPMMYNIVIRYQSQMPRVWEKVSVVVVRPGPPGPGPCHNYRTTDDFLETSLPPGSRGFVEVNPAVCLEAHMPYTIKVMFDKYQQQPDRAASILLDSIVIAPAEDAIKMRQPVAEDYTRYQCRRMILARHPTDQLPEICQRLFCAYGALILDSAEECVCDVTGSKSSICAVNGGQCDCKTNVIGRKCDHCAPGTFGFGPQGCTSCECNSVGSLDNFCDVTSGQCSCRGGVYGRRCDSCELGYWGFPNCRLCECNGHANTCDQTTGACIECRDRTTGHQCERCQDGYYGDPRIGVDLKCKPCPCPGGPNSGKQHADTCYLEGASQDVKCNCKPGYIGLKCDQCDVNYWGNPNDVGGSCERCDCYNNIDFNVPESCDPKTGRCTKCLYNTEGQSCENCVAGYFGDAKIRQCHRCVCNHLGTNETSGVCDRVSGQCPCYPNVEGQQCDHCIADHWNISSADGCEACACEPQGVRQDHAGQPLTRCNDFDGQCECRPDRGGRTCADCQDLYWGDPKVSCQRCECNQIGSSTMQCDRTSGKCRCLKPYGGDHCDQCARGYTGRWPECQPCGECFTNWDTILDGLKNDTNRLVDEAQSLESTGVTSVYDKEFHDLEHKLEAVRQRLQTANVSKADIDVLRKDIDQMKQQLKDADTQLTNVDVGITKTGASADSANSTLQDLRATYNRLSANVGELEQNMTRLKESDIDGAFNSTRDAVEASRKAEQKAEQQSGVVEEAGKMRRVAERHLKDSETEFQEQFRRNQQQLEELESRLRALESSMPDVNSMVCGKRGDPCDDICGGAGCNRCGGQSCSGAVTRAGQAKALAMEAKEKLDKKQEEVQKLLKKLQDAVLVSENAQQEAMQAFRVAERAAQRANQTKLALETIKNKLDEFLKDERATPWQIRTVAEEVLGMSISLTPEEIRDLSDKIKEKLTRLDNIQLILQETRASLNQAQTLKNSADNARKRAEEVEQKVRNVLESLKRAQDAQQQARQAVGSAQDSFDQAKADLEKIGDVRKDIQANVSHVSTIMEDVDKTLNNLQTQHTRTDSEADLASQVAKIAEGLTENAKQKLESAEQKLKDAKDAFSNTQSQGGQQPRQRAQQLRERATNLVTKTDKYLTEIEESKKKFNAAEISLDGYVQSIETTKEELIKIAADITKKKHFHDTCQA